MIKKLYKRVEKFRHNHKGALNIAMVGGLAALLIMIIITAMVFYQVAKSVPRTDNDTNATVDQVKTTARTVFTLMTVLAIVVVAVLIMAVVMGAFGKGGGGGFA